ncbi:hypothetical protein ISS40_10905 [Candidatus Bathyarchaeota archaeon]|nr:hypothetical protein [Candidatus Bathyarchaeota archaeon]
MRYNRRSQEQAEETRKVQLLMQIHQSQDEAYQHRRMEVVNLDFSDLDDFEENTTRDQFVKWAAMMSQWNILGLMLKMGFFDTEMLFEYLHACGPIVHWEKFKPIILEYRERNKWYSFCGGMEYLAEEMERYRDEQEEKLV